MEQPKRFTNLLIMNTGFGTGDVALTPGFKAWRRYSADNPDLDIAKLMKRSCPHLSMEECRAYSAPYPDKRYKAAVRMFPKLVPEHFNDGGAELGRQARDWFTTDWSGKTFMVVGAQDPVLGVAPMQYVKKRIRHCPEPLILEKAGHFVQEFSDDFIDQAITHLSTHQHTSEISILPSKL